MKRQATITSLVAILSTFAGAAIAEPSASVVTSKCLGDLSVLMSCPEETAVQTVAGSSVCRRTRGRDRHGPSLWYHDDGPKQSRIARAGWYIDRRKSGRHYRFARDGRLVGFNDYRRDDYHGISVRCHPNGNVSDVFHYTDGKLDGVTSRWTATGEHRYSTRYRNGKRIGRVDLNVAPPDVCRPVRCSISPTP